MSSGKKQNKGNKPTVQQLAKALNDLGTKRETKTAPQNAKGVVRNAPPITKMKMTQKPATASPATTEKVCGLVDAFCDSSVGARIPDEFALDTGTYRASILYPVSTGAGGYAGLSFWVSPDYYCIDVQAPVGSSYPISNGPSAFISNPYGTLLAQVAKQVRVVTAGVRYWSTLPSTASGGYIQSTEVAPHSQDNQAVTLGALQNFLPNVTVQDVRQPFTWLSRPTSAMTKEFYVPSLAGTPAANANNSRWSNLVMGFFGPTSTQLGFIEFVINLEYTLYAGPAQIAAQGVKHTMWSQIDEIVDLAAGYTHAKLRTAYDATTDVVRGEVVRLARLSLLAATGAAARGAQRRLLM